MFHAFVATAGATGKTWAQFAEEHYNTYGRFEGANPNATFNTDEYLAANPDVAAAGVNPFTHYLHFGVNEGRAPNDRFPAREDFDHATYLAANPDLGEAGIDTAEEAYAHFVIFGQFEDRPGAPEVDTGVPGATYNLTAGIDNFVGTKNNDTFNATETATPANTLTNMDAIDGGAGVDTLKVVQSGAIDTTAIAGLSIKNVENIQLTSGAAVTTNTTGFVGATSLTSTSVGAATLTSAATTNIAASVAAQAAGAVSVQGGKDVSVTTVAGTTGTVNVGTTTAAAGKVSVVDGNTFANAANATLGAINVTGGTEVSVSQASGAAAATKVAANSTVTQGDVTVAGGSATTSVSITQDAAVTAVAGAGATGKVGVVVGKATVTDANAASTTAAGTIASVTLNSYGVGSAVNSGALSTLNLSGTGADLTVTAGALTTPAVAALALNTNGLTTTGNISLDADYKTLNVTNSGAASTVANVTGTGVTALNIAGDAAISFTAQTFAAVKDIVSTNTAGVTLGTALAVNTSFTGGAGNDTVSVGATTKAINMGAGDDVVHVSTTTLGAGGSINGGDGVDTLVANTNGSAFIGLPGFSGFEVLRVAGAAAQGTHNAVGFTALEVGATAGATAFTNVAAGVGLTVLAAPTGGTTVTLANATGTADVFELGLKSAATINAGFVNLAGVETINITNIDTSTTTANSNTLNLVATEATSVSVSGNAGLTVNNVGNTKITSFDASGIQGAAADAAALGVTFVSANNTVAEAVSIKGGSGNDVLTGSATANDTIVGGAGDDILVYNGGADTFTGGEGKDTFGLTGVGTKAAYLTITDATAGDMINFAAISQGTIANGALGAKVTLGAAATFDQYLDAAAAGDGGTNALVKWFQFGDDTYVVLDNTAGAAFAATDSVVKLTGAIDLSTSALAAEILTFA